MFKVGDVVIVKASLGSGHGTPIGTKIKVTYVNQGGRSLNGTVVPAKGKRSSTAARMFYFEEVTAEVLTKEGLEGKRKEIMEELKDIDSKLLFLSQHGLDEYSDREYLVFEVLNKLDEKSSQIDKAKAIAKLIDGGV